MVVETVCEPSSRIDVPEGLMSGSRRSVIALLIVQLHGSLQSRVSASESTTTAAFVANSVTVTTKVLVGLDAEVSLCRNTAEGSCASPVNGNGHDKGTPLPRRKLRRV